MICHFNFKFSPKQGSELCPQPLFFQNTLIWQVAPKTVTFCGTICLSLLLPLKEYNDKGNAMEAKQHLSNSIIISNVLLRSYISCLRMSDSGQDCEKHNRCFSRCIFSSLSFLSRCLWHQVCSSLCPAAPRKAQSMVACLQYHYTRCGDDW